MTAAANLTNVEVKALLQQGVMCWKRGEFLGELARCFRRPVMVGGSHGKSSTSAMLGWILRQNDLDAGLLLGAKYNDQSRHARLGNGDILVAEADESDHTIVQLHGELALITNIDGDHAWSAAEEEALEHSFCRFARQFRKCIAIASEKTISLLGKLENVELLDADKLAELQKLLPATMLGYERLNAALALAGAEYLGINLPQAAKALTSYPGIQRRQGELFRSNDERVVILEDYAHHPTELTSSLEVLRERYKKYNIIVVFQPHRYQRLRRYFNEFAEILSQDGLQVKVLPVFSAWEASPLDALENSDLAAAINQRNGNAEAVSNNYSALASDLAATALDSPEPILIALIGAGDINQLGPELIQQCKQCKEQ